MVHHPRYRLRGTLRSTGSSKRAPAPATPHSRALRPSLDIPPTAGALAGSPVQISSSQPTREDGELEAAFQQFYEQVKTFSRDVRRHLGPGSGADARIRAARNVHVARTMFGKWSLEILSALYGDRSIGFEDLRRTLHGITPSVLSYRLKRMESHGMVAREVQATRPVRVRYRLTDKGLTVAVLGEPVFLFLQYTEAKEGRAG
jgi:DNA-binding HxlR family transcriptional regulator